MMNSAIKYETVQWSSVKSHIVRTHTQVQIYFPPLIIG